MTAAVIITHNRPELLRECVDAIGPQVDFTVVIDNASVPSVSESVVLPAHGKHGTIVVYESRQPPNIAAMWNLGLSLVSVVADPYVAFLCDDAVVPPGWFAAVTATMMETGAVAGCSNPFGVHHPPALKTVSDHDLFGRMVGWAFVLDTSSDVRPDESMHWWWCDTDIDWQAREHGGMVMVGGFTVENRLPNDFTLSRPELAERTGADAAAFTAKWGEKPW